MKSPRRVWMKFALPRSCARRVLIFCDMGMGRQGVRVETQIRGGRGRVVITPTRSPPPVKRRFLKPWSDWGEKKTNTSPERKRAGPFSAHHLKHPRPQKRLSAPARGGCHLWKKQMVLGAMGRFLLPVPIAGLAVCHRSLMGRLRRLRMPMPPATHFINPGHLTLLPLHHSFSSMQNRCVSPRM